MRAEVQAFRDQGALQSVVPDQIAQLTQALLQTQPPFPIRPPVWGLDRVDQAATQLDQQYNYYQSAGQNSTVYVIDTGIYTAHLDFEGRAEWGKDFTGEGEVDNYGHGTHVAGTVGGATYGVAKKVGLVAVKVLDHTGSGSYTNIISAIQWVVADCSSGARPSKVRLDAWVCTGLQPLH